ncbi:MAG: hypothetical protein ACREUL_18570 [Steroidobacteraceae bacterium]
MTTDTNSAVLREKLAALAPSVEGASLYVLGEIDRTVDGLQAIERFLESFAAIVRLHAERIHNASITPSEYLDPDDKYIDQLETSCRGVEEMLPKMRLVTSSSVDQDQRYDGEQKELLRLALDRWINSVEMFLEATKDLRGAIIRHDLAAEPPPSETFDSAEALISSLHARS